MLEGFLLLGYYLLTLFEVRLGIFVVGSLEALFTALAEEFGLSKPILSENLEVFIDCHVVVDDVLFHIEDIFVSLVLLVMLKCLFSVTLLAFLQLFY